MLNILGRRPDGFHELETVLQPVNLWDRLELERAGTEVHLTCSEPALPADHTNLVFRAAQAFFQRAELRAGVRIHLEKKVPLAAGLGGGSSNAANTLVALNQLFDTPLSPTQLEAVAASLGSDVPFFLQDGPALGLGRGERVTRLAPFPALRGLSLVLIHPGFGVSTAWAYQQLARFPEAGRGQPGRAQRLIEQLGAGDLKAASGDFYNALEAPVLCKYPLLVLFQEFLRAHGAEVALMSGSGSSTFALVRGQSPAQELMERCRSHFGPYLFTAAIPL